MSDLRKFIFNRQSFFSSYRDEIVYYTCVADIGYDRLQEGSRISIVKNNMVK